MYATESRYAQKFEELAAEFVRECYSLEEAEVLLRGERSDASTYDACGINRPFQSMHD